MVLSMENRVDDILANHGMLLYFSLPGETCFSIAYFFK